MVGRTGARTGTLGTLALVLSALTAPTGGEGASDAALLEAARQGDVARLHHLLRGGAAVAVRDAAGFTPLILAAPSAEATRVLVRAGADVNASTPSGWTALMQAAESGAVESIRLLVAAGASVHARDRLWGTALDVAHQRKQPQAVQALRARGAGGSGRSVGDAVCVRPWGGEGACGTIAAVDEQRVLIRVESLVGCDAACGRPEGPCPVAGGVGGTGTGVGGVFWTSSACLTHTGREPAR